MSSLKRKKRALEEEHVLSRAEETAFQSAFFVLNNDTESTSNDSHYQPLSKRQRVENNDTNNHVPELMDVCPDVVGSYSLGDKQVKSIAQLERTAMAPHDFDDRKKRSRQSDESRNAIKKEAVHLPVNTAVNPLQLVKERIHTLVSIHGPSLSLSRLPSLYRATFGRETLDYKAMGFKKLKQLIESVDSVEMECLGNEWALSLSADGGPPRRHVPTRQNERKARLRQVRKRICLVVDKHSPLAMNHLIHHYEAEFAGDTLDYKAFGFPTLNKLIKSLALASIKMKVVQGEWMLITATPKGGYSKDRKEQVVSRIEAVVAKYQPLLLGQLIHCYETLFPGDTLDFKAMGFSKLKMLAQSIDSIKMKVTGNNAIVLSSLAAQKNHCRRPEDTKDETMKVSTENSLLAAKPTQICNNDYVKDMPTVAPESQEAVEVFSGPKSIAEAQVAVRLQLLVTRQHAPLDLSTVSSQYHYSFGERLDVKALGYDKLSSFVASLPFIHMMKSGNYWILSQSTASPTVAVADSSHVVDRNNVSGFVPKNAENLGSDSVSLIATENDSYRAHSQDAADGSFASLDPTTTKEDEAAFQGIAGMDDQQVETKDVAMSLHVDDESAASEPHVTASTTDVASLFVLDYTGAHEVNEENSRKVLVDVTAANETVVHHSNALKESQRVENALPPGPHKPSNSDTVGSEVQRRVQVLIARHSPLDICGLSQLYQDFYGELLDYKSLGYGKLKNFLLSIPHVAVQQNGRRWYLSSSLDVTTNDVDVVFTGGRVFGCLGCGIRSNVWGQLLNHMDTCCPDKIKAHKLQQKCRIGHKKCKVPHQEKAITEPATESDCCGLYGCISCGDLQGEWTATLQHMALCCPERIVDCATNAFQRRCTIGDAMCNVPGHERMDESFRYGCPDCGKLQMTWAECLKHMQACCILLLADKNGLMRKCRLGDDNCEVPGFDKLTTVATDEIKEARGDRHSTEMKENQNRLNDETHAATLSPFDLEVSRLTHLVSQYEPLPVSKVQTMYRSEYDNERTV